MKCKIEGCDNPVFIKKDGKPSLFCSISCRAKYNSKNSIEKRKNTNLLKYGTDNPSKSEKIKEKLKNTMIERYGVEYASHLPQSKKIGDKNPMRDPEVKNKFKESLIKKYGVDNIFKLEKYRQIRENTFKEKYGVSNPLQSPEVKEKRKQNYILKYNRENNNQYHESDESYEILNDIDELIKLNLTQISNKLGVSKGKIRNSFIENNIDIIRHGNKSSFQDEIIEFLQNIGVINIIKNDKNIIGKELDIYLPDHNLAIECNGTFFHCEKYGNKKSDYHITKTKLCEDKNIRLIHIFQHRWESDKNKIKSILKSATNKLEIKKYARKLKIIKVEKEQEKEFFDFNHIQKYKPSKICFGLIDDKNNLVCAMSFCKSRYNKNYDIELLRYCNKLDTVVIGGANKLFEHFIKLNPNKKIISYCDRSLFSGNMYKKLGMIHHSDSRPSYFYTKNYKTWYNRIQFQKHKLKQKLINFDPCLSEWANMQNNGWDRYWDCGNSVWIYDK
jgi:hypothetical protein